MYRKHNCLLEESLATNCSCQSDAVTKLLTYACFTACFKHTHMILYNVQITLQALTLFTLIKYSLSSSIWKTSRNYIYSNNVLDYSLQLLAQVNQEMIPCLCLMWWPLYTISQVRGFSKTEIEFHEYTAVFVRSKCFHAFINSTWNITALNIRLCVKIQELFHYS